MRFGGKKGNVLRLIFEAFWGMRSFFSSFPLRGCLIEGCLPPVQAIISLFVTCVSQEEAGNTVNHAVTGCGLQPLPLAAKNSILPYDFIHCLGEPLAGFVPGTIHHICPTSSKRAVRANLEPQLFTILAVCGSAGLRPQQV